MGALFANPVEYFASPELLSGTIVNCICGDNAGAIAGMALQQKLDRIKNCVYGSLPDDMWQKAYNTSHTYAAAALGQGCLGSLSSNPQAVCEFATHVAVIMLSDDNVSAEVLVVGR